MASHHAKRKLKAKPKKKAVKAPVKKPKAPARSAAKSKLPARKAAEKPVSKGAAKPAPHAGKGAPPAVAGLKIPTPKRPGGPGRGPSSKKTSRRSTLYQRRGPNGELITPGDLLLPGGPLTPEEVHYFLRGTVAAEHPLPGHGVSEILTKRGLPETDGLRDDLAKHAAAMAKRFESGAIEAMPPGRSLTQRRTFQSVVDRAKQRRREIGSFLRGLHLGGTETSHMDSHGEASLHNLMEWSARIENLIEAEEPRNADYTQFHRGLDHLDNTTEALVVDVELTLRRLRNRAATAGRG